MVTTIEIISTNLWEYGILILISTYFLLTYSKDFSQEGLIDYFIYLTTKIILFIVSFSLLIVFSIILINGLQANTESFLQELIKQILTYGFINYGILYLIKFIAWLVDLTKKNDLYNMEFITKVEVKEK